MNDQENIYEQAVTWKALLRNSPLMPMYQWIKITRENLYTHIPLRPGVRILDVGSGAVSSSAREVIHQGGAWLAVEVDQRKCDLLKKSGLQTFCGDLEAFQATHPEPFDFIVLSQVLEHIYQPRQFLPICRSLLKPNGRIILSCPNYDSFLQHRLGQRWLHWHIHYHVAHYARHNLTSLAFATGFAVAKFSTFTPVTWYYAQQQISRGKPYSDQLVSRDGLRWGGTAARYLSGTGASRPSW